MSKPVGADIESLCGKCGDVWHVVVAKVGDRIAKVQCKQCGGQHRHRPPGGGTAPRRSPRTTAKSASKRPSRARSKEPEVPAVEFDPSVPPRPYLPTERFEIGERIEHRSFGTGVVEALTGPGKMQVFFTEGRKLLIHERG